MYIALIALIPVIGGGLAKAFKFKTDRARNIYIETLTVLTSALVLISVISGRGGEVSLFRLNDVFVCSFGLDGPGKLFAFLIALLWPFASLYGFEYMEHEERRGNFFVFYTMAYGVALMLSAARNLFTLYIFYELLTVITLPLVEHGQNKEAYRAGRAYLLYLIGGAGLGFAALIIAHGLADSGTAFRLGGIVSGDKNVTLIRIAFMLGFVGFGVKAAVFPLSRWLPKASCAPTPVTALLHAVAVVNAGVYSVMRVCYYVFPKDAVYGSYAQYTVMLLSAATVAYGAVRAFRESHLKRRLAWSTVSNLGYMLFALSLLTDKGINAALSHMLFHSAMKIALFFCAGAIMVKSGKTDIHEMRGLAHRMPAAFAVFALAGAALTGVPPLCGFTSKYLIITAALENPSWAQIIGAVSLIVSAILTAFYIFTVIVPAYFAPENDEVSARCDMGIRMKISSIAVCAMILALSIFSNKIYEIITALQGSL